MASVKIDDNGVASQASVTWHSDGACTLQIIEGGTKPAAVAITLTRDQAKTLGLITPEIVA